MICLTIVWAYIQSLTQKYNVMRARLLRFAAYYKPHFALLFTTGGGGILVWENFCPEKFRRGKIPPQSLKVMAKIAPPFSMVKGKA